MWGSKGPCSAPSPPLKDYIGTIYAHLSNVKQYVLIYTWSRFGWSFNPYQGGMQIYI